MKEYFTGCDDFVRAERLEGAMISANALRHRKSPDIKAGRWMLDSGAFSQITLYGDFVMTPKEYVALAVKYQHNGDLACIVTQDYMCEPEVLALLNASVRIHQHKTVHRYIEILEEARRQGLKVPVMPVLQGWEVEDYPQHWRMYCRILSELKYFGCDLKNPFMDRPQYHGHTGELLNAGQWMGIGSTCKRNRNPEAVEAILDAIHIPYEWYRVHAFGLKTTALRHQGIKDRLYSADSMAYDFADRLEGNLRTREERSNSAVRWGDGIKHNNVQQHINLE